MWFIPLLVLGALALAAASSRSRDAAPPSRQLAPPPGPAITSGVPGPISVLGEILRVGQAPPPQVILCAIAEAESIGRGDLASDIVQAFVVPAVHARHSRGTCLPPPGHARVSCALPRDPRAQDYQRGSCAPIGSPRAQADVARGSCAPIGSPRAQDYQRGSCAPAGSPRAHADAARGARAPSPSSSDVAADVAVPQIAARYATQDEILALLQTDPSSFLKVMATGRAPVVEVPIAATPPIAAPVAAPPGPPVQPAVESDQLAAHLVQLPGFAGAGVVIADPSTGAEVFEVSWLRGYAVPALPPRASDRAVRVVIVDALPAVQPASVAPPPGLPTEVAAQMQEGPGFRDAADQARATVPGSPLGHVPDDAWRTFVVLLAREAPQFESSRHVGQYRQRRERLAELGVDPRAIHGSAAAQRAALDADLADAHRHAAEGGLLAEHLRRTIAVPGHDGPTAITLSGLLGVIQCAGLDGAVGWLERPNDRKRYPHTTQAFLRTNGVF